MKNLLEELKKPWGAFSQLGERERRERDQVKQQPKPNTKKKIKKNVETIDYYIIICYNKCVR